MEGMPAGAPNPCGEKEVPGQLHRALRGLILLSVLYAAVGAYAADVRTATDSFVGNGRRGPFVLSWRGIQRGSEVVTVNGIRQFRDRDYLVDPDGGLLVFDMPLQPGDSVRIQYNYDAATAKRNSATAINPTFNLLSRGSTSLSASVLTNSSSGSSALGSPQFSAFGLSAQTAGSQWRTSAMAVLGAGRDPMGERSGLKLGTGYAAGGLNLSADFARAGQHLDPAKTFGMAKGAESAQLQASYAPKAGWWDVSSSLRSDATLGDSEMRQTIARHLLDVRYTKGGQFTASRETKQLSRGGTASTTVTDVLRLTQNVGSTTTVDLSRTAIDAGSAGGRTETTQLSVDAKPSNAVALSAAVTRRDADGKDAETEQRVDVSAAAGVVRAKGGVSLRQSGNTDESLVSTAVEVRPTPLVGVSATVSQRLTRSGDDLERELQAGAQADLGVLKWAKLVGKLNHNLDGSSVRDRVEANLVATPWAPVKLSASLSQDVTPGAQSAVQDAKLEVKPNSALAVTADVHRELKNDSVAEAAGISAQVTPSSAFAFSGQYRARTGPTPQLDLDTIGTSMMVSPWRYMRLTGSLAINPEDQGVVQQAIRRSLGAETRLGSLLLNGNVGLEERFGGDGLLTQQFGVGLSFRRSTQLMAGYQRSQRLGAVAGIDTAYTLQLSRNLGDTFSLALEGEARWSQVAGGADPLRPEYRGSAKLAANF